MQAYIFQIEASMRSHDVTVETAREQLNLYLAAASELASTYGFELFFMAEEQREVPPIEQPLEITQGGHVSED